MFYAAQNLVTLAVSPSEPWKFVATENITDEIRKVKEARQAWYKLPTTKHNFYTLTEAVCNTQRVSTENPPSFINGAVGDYDVHVPMERIVEAIKLMPVKPTWIEISLGGNFRLIWVFQTPIPVDGTDFCIYVLKAAHEWLRMDLLPLLDRKALESPSRLFCNGGQWVETGFGPVPTAQSQAFFVDCGKEYRFKSGDSSLIPLDVVEPALKAKYPNFNWPGDFTLGSQGPTFWVPESVSPQSALVKEGGIFSFAAHAGKPFYSWTDLLGKEFTKGFQANAIAKATADIWWDSKRFWLKKDGFYVSLDRTEMLSYLKVTCRLSEKPDSSGVSPLAQAVEHIYRQQSVIGAGPFIFVPPGLYMHDGMRKLNTWMGKPMDPATGSQKWGPHGNFPMLAAFQDQFLSSQVQLAHLLAWGKYFFECAVNWCPMPGPNSITMGIAGIGKTYINRHCFGPCVGGFVDASNYLVDGSQFNSELIGSPLWCLDDDSPSSSPAAQNRLQSMMKKTAANQEMMCNTKFEKSCMVGWAGRIACTTNLDFVSTRIIGPLDNTSLDKTALYRCNPRPTFKFPSRTEWLRNTRIELPFWMRYLIDHTPPDFVERDVRYGYKPYHEKSLLEVTRQGSNASTFKEVLVDFLLQYFSDHPKELFWEGTVTELLRPLLATACNDIILRHLKMEQVSRHLEQIQRDGSFKITTSTGRHSTRIWRIYRDDTVN